MKFGLIGVLIVLLSLNVFAVFPGESIHVMDFEDCEYLNVVADENCFVFDGCNRTDSFGFEWRCQCVNDEFSLNATVRADAAIGSFSVSGNKFDVEVVSLGFFERKQTIFKEPVTVFVGCDSNQEIAVVDGNCGVIVSGCSYSEEAYLEAIDYLGNDINTLYTERNAFIDEINRLSELSEVSEPEVVGFTGLNGLNIVLGGVVICLIVALVGLLKRVKKEGD